MNLLRSITDKISSKDLITVVGRSNLVKQLLELVRSLNAQGRLQSRLKKLLRQHVILEGLQGLFLHRLVVGRQRQALGSSSLGHQIRDLLQLKTLSVRERSATVLYLV